VLSGLRRKHPFCFIAMAFTLTILFICILNRNLLIREVMAVQIVDGIVGSFEIGERDEAVALGEIGIVPSNLPGG